MKNALLCKSLSFLAVAAFLFACSDEGGGVVVPPEQSGEGGSSSSGGLGNLSSSSESDDWKYTGPKDIAECPVAAAASGPVSHYGRLQAREGQAFIDGIKENGDVVDGVQIRGVSLFWSQWAGQFYNANAIERLAKDWKAEVVRAAYGSTGGQGGQYPDSPAERQKIKTVVDAAIENDIYVIIDWHSHNAHKETAQAQSFFKEMAQIYGGCDNVIFELYNEPTAANGGTWPNIKAYAKEVIPVIRKHSENLILVGTPNYSRSVQSVVNNAISDENVGYVLHFYSNTHSLSSNRSNIDNALNAGLPIFVTEYGTTDADGGCSPQIDNNCSIDHYSSHNAASSNEWHSYMDSKKISSAAWSVFDKYEGSAFFGTVPRGAFDQDEDENWSNTDLMTVSGAYIFGKLNDYYSSAPWK